MILITNRLNNVLIRILTKDSSELIKTIHVMNILVLITLMNLSFYKSRSARNSRSVEPNLSILKVVKLLRHLLIPVKSSIKGIKEDKGRQALLFTVKA